MTFRMDRPVDVIGSVHASPPKPGRELTPEEEQASADAFYEMFCPKRRSGQRKPGKKVSEINMGSSTDYFFSM